MAQPVAHPLIAESQTLIREELAGGIHGLRLPITIPDGCNPVIVYRRQS
jgi:hypothetical protein